MSSAAGTIEESEQQLTDEDNPELEDSICGAYENIRERYNVLSEDIQKSCDESGEGGVAIEDLLKSINRADEIFSRVKRPQEERLDTKCLKQIALLGRIKIEKTQSCLLSFNPSEYADNLLSYMNVHYGDIEDATNQNSTQFDLSDEAVSASCKKFENLYSKTYGMEPIFGALDWKAPEKNKKHIDKDSASQKKADKVIKISETANKEKSEVSEINRLYMILNKRYLENKKNSIIFMEFIVDPNSFSNTVENLFHTSFLLHDGFAMVAPCKQYKIPRISPVPPSDRANNSREDRPNCQVVLNMNMKVWQELIYLLDLKGKSPMIPPKSSNKRKV